MNKTLIYSCVFFNEKYIHLVNVLLKSYILFGDPSDHMEYLIICNPSFKDRIQRVYDHLNINGKIWCIDLNTKFEAGYSRLKIFDYPDINTYEKILYLDCDILVTNSIHKVLDFELEDKLYVLQEGNTRYKFWGNDFFDKNPNCPAFTSGILLFNRSKVIKDLFSKILLHISNHLKNNLPIPGCLDQPFIIYHAIKDNLYNNKKLIHIVVNNPNSYNGESISHFSGGPGHYKSKIVKMTNYMNDIMFNINKSNYLKIHIDEYKSVLNNNKHHFDTLYTICKDIGEKVEGNCFTQHLNIDNKIDKLIYKQMNHFSLGKNAKNIMEIGFNAGHSSLLYLLSNPDSIITIFDLCEHKYTLPCFKYLQSVFPNRLQIYPGDSTETVPQYYNVNPDTKFDLIHIDGAHVGDTPNKDFYNSLKLASDIIIWDDTQIRKLNILLNGYIRKGLVSELFLYDTLIYKHRICRINQLLNKTYTWNNSSLTFLENGTLHILNSKGKYSFIENNLIKCNLKDDEYLLKFNEDYTGFISIRKGDFSIDSSDKYTQIDNIN